MKKIIRYSILVAIAAMGCTGSQAQKIENTDAQGFQDKMKTMPKKVILDVRTSQEFNNGHIPGAVNMNIYDADFETQISTLDTNTPVFVYCLAGGRSSQAADVLAEKGFKNIVNLSKGYSQWNSSGFPTEQGPQAEKPAKGMGQEAFNAATNHKDTLVLVDFNAKWCTPCRKIAGILSELEKEYAGKMLVVTLDYDQNSEIIASEKVKTVPTLRIYKAGQKVWEHEGAIEKSELQKAIDSKL